MKTRERSFKSYITFTVIYKIARYLKLDALCQQSTISFNNSSLHGLGYQACSDITYTFHLFQGLLGLSTLLVYTAESVPVLHHCMFPTSIKCA
jgi:hypothetical protein